MVTPEPLELNAIDSMAFLSSETARLAHTGRNVKLTILVTSGNVSTVRANVDVIMSASVVSVRLVVRSALHQLGPLHVCRNKIVSISVDTGVWNPGRRWTAGSLAGLIGQALEEFTSPGNAHAQLRYLESSIGTLRVLRVQSSGIQNLNFIERFVELTELDVSDNPDITRLFSRGSLLKLVTLNLSGCQLKSLTPLGVLQNLRTLHVSRTPVVNLRPLVNCLNLETVFVDAQKHERLLGSYVRRHGLPIFQIRNAQ